MDDIEKAKIGKKEEPLVGWDHIRKPKMNTNYPPMRARGAKDRKYFGTLTRYTQKNAKWILLVVIIIALVGTKILGVW
jgi:hypothetical protein